ncbi:MAG: LLM class flavin-dependent oxidoreductase [Chloroflexi bacterium]|nr:LLM class flavin-dependent oxidoreductase [Chloroflexota bacterium]
MSGPRTRDALETFVSFVLVATESRRIRFGPLVCSKTFRHPSLLARMATQVDRLSGSRFIMGFGAGWNVPEHEAFGLPFLPP